jgi:aldose 1-epimerase
MPFTISQSDEQDLHFLQLNDSDTGILVKILPDYGALLHEFSIPLRNGRLQAISSYKSLSDLRMHHPLFYRSAKLSPFPCRIYQGRYQFEGKHYEFKNKFTDGSAIHGLVAGKPFSRVQEHTDETSASVVLQYMYAHEDPGYPFDYRITVEYALKKAGRLFLKTTLANLSAVPIPIADGWHPYFSLGGKVNDWVLTVRAKEMLVFGENLIPNGQKVRSSLFSSPSRIGTLALDHCFLPEFGAGEPVCTLFNPANGAALSFFPDPAYAYLQIYSPDDRNSLAIENLSAAPDCFNNGMGLSILEPGSTQSFTTCYQLDLQ